MLEMHIIVNCVPIIKLIILAEDFVDSIQHYY